MKILHFLVICVLLTLFYYTYSTPTLHAKYNPVNEAKRYHYSEFSNMMLRYKCICDPVACDENDTVAALTNRGLLLTYINYTWPDCTAGRTPSHPLWPNFTTRACKCDTEVHLAGSWKTCIACQGDPFPLPPEDIQGRRRHSRSNTTKHHRRPRRPHHRQ